MIQERWQRKIVYSFRLVSLIFSCRRTSSVTDNVPITRTMSWCLPFAGKSDRDLWVFLIDINVPLAEPVPTCVGEVVVSACRATIIRCVVPNSKDGKDIRNQIRRDFIGSREVLARCTSMLGMLPFHRVVSRTACDRESKTGLVRLLCSVFSVHCSARLHDHEKVAIHTERQDSSG